MKTYSIPTINVVDLQMRENVLLNVSSGGTDGTVQGIGSGTIEGSGARVPVRVLWI